MYKVCVIEDETIIRKGLIKAINWEKYNCRVVAEAGNGKEGLRVIESSKPDIIVLDINMPVMDGLEMLSKLANNIYSFIIVSGHSEFDYAKKAIKYNVSEYLLKPVDHKLFEDALSRAIEDFEMKKYFLNNNQQAPSEFFILDLNKSVDSVTLNKAIDYIEENLSEKIIMKDIEEVVKKSSTSITKRFKTHLNTNFNDYLTKYRIQTAINLIKGLDYHLYEIAEKVGYKDYKYFNQVFKKVVGVAPKIVETYYLRLNDKI